MSEFVDQLKEIFAPFGQIEAKRMFGGHGVYHDGLMFALVADGVLYLKADGESSVAFSERGLPPFEYDRRGKTTKTSYFQAPEEIFDDAVQAQEWATRAFEAALRARKRNRKSKDE